MKTAKHLLKMILTAALALVFVLQPLAASAGMTKRPAAKTPEQSAAESGMNLTGVTAELTEHPFSEIAENPQEGPAAGAEVTAVAYAETDSVVVQAFVNTLNLMMRKDKQTDENGNWEDPSLKDYPMEPRRLEEYGDSPRVRMYDDGEETPAEAGKSDPEKEKKPNYLVYRESIYLIPEEEAKQYTVTYSADRRTAVLTPSVPWEDLEGKTGIALLGENLELDEVLVFDGAPAPDGDSLNISLAKTVDLRLNHLFSDGYFNIVPVEEEPAETEQTKTDVTAGTDPVGQIAYSGDGKLPARQKAGLFDWADPLLWLDQSISGDGWTGKITDIEPTKPGLWYDLDFWKGSFDWYIYFGVQSDFEFWADRACARETTKEIVSAPISLPLQIWIHMTYRYTVEFGEAMHVKGHAATNIRLGGFLTGIIGQSSSWQAWTDVDFEKVELGTPDANGHYFTDNTLANRESPATFYIGANIDTNFAIFYFKIPVPIIGSRKIGPVLSMDFKLGSGVTGQLWWRKGSETIQDPEEATPVGVTLHSCLWDAGKNGCLDLRTDTSRTYEIDFTISIIVKDWHIRLASGNAAEMGSTRWFYQSLTYDETKLTEGICPHELHRVPIHVYTEGPGLFPGDTQQMPVGNMKVTTTNLKSPLPDAEEPFSEGVTDNGGDTAVYLPYVPEYRYRFMATGRDGGELLFGTGVQPEDMIGGMNETVEILVSKSEQQTFTVSKKWETDYYGQDKPEQIQVVLQRWDEDSRTWQPAETDTAHLPAVAELKDGQPDCSFTVPRFKTSGDVTTEILYRVRELDCGEPIDVSGYADMNAPEQQALMNVINSHVVHDPGDADRASGETAGYVVYPVEAYVDHTGTLHPNHETKYRVSYASAETGDGTAVTITNTAVYDVGLHKQWIGIPEEERPEYVYLALMGETETGWENEALYYTEHYYGVMKPLADPLGGDALSLAQIAENGDLFLSDALDRKYTIVKVSPETDWSGYLTIRKYYEGIPFRYQAAELDETIVRRILEYDYNLHLEVHMQTGGDWTTFSGAAYSISADYTLTGTVINSRVNDPEHTISGVKYWIPGETGSYPDRVTLQVWRTDKDENGKETRTKVGEPFDVLRPGPPAGETEKKMWAWTFTHPDIDPDQTYTVEESLPRDYADWEHYVSLVEGTDVINVWTDGEGIPVKLIVLFDPAYTGRRPDGSVSISHLAHFSGGIWTYASYAWVDFTDPPERSEYPLEHTLWSVPDDNWEISEYLSYPDGTTGPEFIPIYAEPSMTLENGSPVYVFTVMNRLQRNVEVTVTKQWDFPTGKQVYEKMPEEIEVTLWQDSKTDINKIGALKEASGKEQGDGAHHYAISETFTEDKDGNPLQYLDPDGNYNTYEIEETWFDTMIREYDTQSAEEGFLPVYTSEEEDTDGYMHKVHLTVTNKWIDRDTEDYVTVAGRKTWQGDDGKESFRPDSIVLSIVNQRDESVKAVRVPADGQGEIAWSIPGLPRYDRDGTTQMQYRVIESMVDGYTASYADPVYDDATHTWTCNVTNTLTGYFPLKISKVIDGPEDPEQQETFSFTLKKREDVPGTNEEHWTFPMPQGTEEQSQNAGEDPQSTEETAGYTWTITGAGEETLEFLFSEEGLYLYEVKEAAGTNADWIYDTEPRLVLITVFRNESGGMDITAYADKDKSGSGEEADEAEIQAILPTIQTDEVTFTNSSTKNTLTVKKEWDIDIEKKDHPDSIEVVIQRKTGEGDSAKWETVEKVELNGDNDWQKEAEVPEKDSDGKEYEYRVRELAPKNGLRDTLQNLANEYAGQAKEKFDEWIGKLKAAGKDWINGLPEEIRDAAEQGYDALAQKLGATEEDIFSKLKEKIQFTSDEERIVFDKDDRDKPGKQDGEEKEPETNLVAYKVPSYVSVLSGNVDEHETRYRVSYKKDDSTYTITNLAITEIDLTKRWFIPGGDDEDKPDSAWVVLLFNVDPEVLEKAGDIPGAGDLIGKLKDIQLPLFKLTSLLDDFNNLLSGGINPVNLVSELALGFDLDIFGLADGISVSVARVDEDSNWTTHFTAKKYTLGFPVEYTGAELSSEIIRQFIKYIFHLNLHVSWTPFGNYVSIPGQAYGNLADASSIQDLFDLDDSSITGQITGALMDYVLDELNDLLGEILPDGLPVGLEDWELAANVINVRIVLPEIPETVEIEKHWVGRDDMEIPDSITLEVELTLKDGSTRTEIIELKKEDYPEKYDWTLDLNEYIRAQNGNSGDNGEENDDNPVEDARILSETLPEEYADQYDTDIDGREVTNTWITPGKVTVFGRKVWDDDDNSAGERPDRVTVSLLANGVQATCETQDEQGRTVTNDLKAETSEAAEWKFSFPDLPEKDENGQKITYSVEEEPVPEYITEISEPENGTASVRYTVTNRYQPAKAPDIRVEKIWEDENDQDRMRPETVTVRLLRTATPEEPDTRETAATAELSEENNWTYTFTGLKKNENVKALTYTVEEDAVEGYESAISGPAEDGDALKYTITNTHVPGTVEVRGTKTWDDDSNRDGIRPDSVTVVLLKNGSETARQTISAEDGWKYSFTNLPKAENGTVIRYTVDEEPVTGYEKEVTGYDITNRHVPAVTDIRGEKIWDDDNDRDGIRPDSVTVILYGNGSRYAEQTVTAENDWKFSFPDVPENEDGRPVSYTVDEQPVAGYEKRVEGYTITNSHVPGTVDISGQKIWDDDNDRDGIRPDSVTVKLLKNGEEIARQDTSAEYEWKYSFPNLPQAENGMVIPYTVDEKPVIGYEKEINGNNIINRHQPALTDIRGKKVWDDDDNRDGIRPDSVTVILYGNGSRYDEQTVTADNGWQFSFPGVPENEDGKPVSYTVDEEPVAGYEKRVDGLTVTNRHVPGTVNISGEKIWDDHDNQDGIRPDSVTVILYGNGSRYAEQTVTAENDWKFSFPGVPENEDGKPVSYTVDEQPVTGYEKRVDGFTVTNSHVPGTVDISGQKVWDDEDDRDGIRPDSVTVKLLKNGEETASRVTSADYGWKYSFANLPKAENGMVIRYTVKEDPVLEGYTAEINGYEIINSHDPKEEEEKKKYTITYDPNGGTLSGSTQPVSSEHEENEVITIREAPVREGYTFLYWKGSEYKPKGSEYHPGDKYTVTEDHLFIAQWEKEEPEPPDNPGPPDYPGPPEPGYDYRFTFTKKWSGGHEDSIDWTLYDPDGNVVHKRFNKIIVSETEWRYEAWFASEKDYYIIETVPSGYKVRYENKGAHADVTDRCYNGGTIINYRIPKTGDNRTDPLLWIGCILLGLLGMGGAVFVRKRRKGR